MIILKTTHNKIVRQLEDEICELETPYYQNKNEIYQRLKKSLTEEIKSEYDANVTIRHLKESIDKIIVAKSLLEKELDIYKAAIKNSRLNL